MTREQAASRAQQQANLTGKEHYAVNQGGTWHIAKFLPRFSYGIIKFIPVTESIPQTLIGNVVYRHFGR